MPYARGSDADAPASILEHQYDWPSSRKFQYLGNCANPYCCCSPHRPSLRRAVTAFLLAKHAAAESSGLLRHSLAQYGLAHFQPISRRRELRSGIVT